MLVSVSLQGIESPFPSLLVTYAREAHLQLAERPLTRREPMLALLLTVTAAEAVVNRLLEPLVPAEQWDKIERAGAAKKWVRLASELGIGNVIADGQDPLSAFLKLIDARNSLIHFKHRSNLQSLAAEPFDLIATKPGMVGVSELKPLVMGPVEDALDPKRAQLYYPAFEKLVRPALDAYETKESGVVLMLRMALEGKVKETPTK